MLPYQDPELDVAARVKDLISRMTIEEKAAQMVNLAPPIERLGIPQYDWWNECLHGVGRAGRATVFPQAIGMAATFDDELIHRVAVAISDEARAKYHQAQKQGNKSIYFGLTYWSPNVNILRDPRWGRAQETFGEDPWLTARLGVAFVKGLQGEDPKYLKLVATPKHFAAHSGPEEGRSGFDAKVSLKDLEETYLPHFRATVQEGGAVSIMGAYNRLNGEACNASPWLLKKTLRHEWGFQGYVVSDCGAIENIANHHKLAKDNAEAAARSVKAGCDLCCGSAYKDLAEAVSRGILCESEVDQALTRLFTARFRLGMFDPDEKVPYSQIPPSVVDSPEHRELAREVARKSVVLLKNDGLLPLRKDVNSVFVTGPNAETLDVLWGNYNGYNDRMSTLLEGIVGKVSVGTRVMSFPGCLLSGPARRISGMVTYEVPNSEVIVACMGLSPLMEGEEGDVSLDEKGGGDKNSVELPECQRAYLDYLVSLSKKVVLVLTGGSPIALPEAAEKCAAILMVWYPGEEGGNAVADVLFGDANPSGRLPVTFPSRTQNLPPIEDYSMEGRTYRFQKEAPAFRFGYGLSYTSFAYSNLRASAHEVSVTVANDGWVAGDEVVQLYLRDLHASTRVPIHSLAGFQPVRLLPGESTDVTFPIRSEQLTVVLDDGSRVQEPGEFEAFVGGGQPGTEGVVSASFVL